MVDIKRLAITLQRKIESAVDLSNSLHVAHDDSKEGYEAEKKVYFDKEQLIDQFKQLQTNGYVIDRDTQIYIAENAPDVFSLIVQKDPEAIRCILKEWGKTSLYKIKIMEGIDVKNIKDFDKDLIISALCGLGGSVISNNKKDKIEKINEIVKMPSFKELTKDDKINILHFNIYMLSYFESNTYEFQEAALRDEENKFDLIKLIYFSENILMLPNIAILIITHNDEFGLNNGLFRKMIEKYNSKDLEYIREKVYLYSIDLGMKYFHFLAYLHEPGGIELYKKTYDHLISQKLVLNKKGKNKEFTDEEVAFISLAKFIPDMNKNNIINTIVIMPEILSNQSFRNFLEHKYNYEEYKNIISKAASQNKDVLKAGFNDFISNYIDKEVLISIIKECPSYIEYIREPDEILCKIAFKGDSNLYRDIYKYAGMETLVDAICFNPGNIYYAGCLGVYNRELYNLALDVIKRGKKKLDCDNIATCDSYLKALEAYENNQRIISKCVTKIKHE